MPHAIIKLYAGRSEGDKIRLAESVTRAIDAALTCGEDAISVAIEDVSPSDWDGNVYRPDIEAKAETTLYKKPGYGRLR